MLLPPTRPATSLQTGAVSDVGKGSVAIMRSRNASTRTPLDEPTLSSGSSAVRPRRPHRASCGTGTGSSVRGAVNASAVS